MREALNLHPEWNGDWQMPDSIRKAEIDTRNGKLVRELSEPEADSVKAQQTELKNNSNKNANQSLETLPVIATESKEIYVTDIPGEFRRVELFVLGTVPNKTLLPVIESGLDDELNESETRPTPTPFTTWQESQQNQNTNSNTSSQPNKVPDADFKRNITIMICPLTNLRATVNCPDKRPLTFEENKEPKLFCPFHVRQRE
jgi:hypothetical protein